MLDRLAFEETRIPNGIRMFSQHMDVPFFSIQVTIPVGNVHSHDENPGGRHGIAHFLEHMVINRSKRYPEAHSFERFIALHGGYLNAMTGPFFTRYVLKAPVSIEGEALAGLASIIYEPMFVEEDIAIERGVVSNERRQRKYYPGRNELSQYIHSGWMNNRYYSKEQLFGTDDDLAALDATALGQFHQLYHSSDTTIIVCGGHNPAAVAQVFDPITLQELQHQVQLEPITWKTRTYHELSFRDIEHPIYFIGGIFDHYDWHTNITLWVILSALTDSSHGALYQWLRNEKGWTYGVNHTIETNRDRMRWSISMPVNNPACIPEIRSELRSRAREALANPEFISVEKQRILNSALFDFQTADQRVDAAWDSLADMGEILEEHRVYDFIKNLTPDYLIEHFNRWFAESSVGEFLALPLQE